MSNISRKKNNKHTNIALFFSQNLQYQVFSLIFNHLLSFRHVFFREISLFCLPKSQPFLYYMHMSAVTSLKTRGSLPAVGNSDTAIPADRCRRRPSRALHSDRKG